MRVITQERGGWHYSLIYWISDTLSQGYTNLQSLVKCLDHRGIASDTIGIIGSSNLSDLSGAHADWQ